MIEKIIKSAKYLLLIGALASGCSGKYNNLPIANKSYYPSEAQIYNKKTPKSDVIQRASFYVFFDQSKEITPDNLTWNFEYRLMF
ncbi:hypothetical protein KY342_06555 [Candidatus Woesearchaeota archaeon]|nr:hypothetical protein [Candidatus Woesearchaeota archaeon]